MYPLGDVEAIAEAYRASGKKWFYRRHKPELFYPHLDSTLVPLMKYSFGYHRNPVMTAQAALAFYSAYVESDSAKHLEAFMKNIEWLVANHDEFYLRYDFDWNHGGVVLDSGWTSAMAQGEALAAMSSAYWLTGDTTYLATARGFFETLYHSPEDTWVFYVDDERYYWLEEYPTEDRCRVLNGFLFGLWGLWDYYVVAGDSLALQLFAAGIQSFADHYEEWNIGGQDMSWYCLHHRKYQFYHETHLRQMTDYLRWFDIPEFRDAMELFQRYLRSELSLSEINFEDVHTGDIAVASVNLYSTGTDTLRVQELRVGKPVFEAEPDTAAAVAPGDSLVITVTFQPTVSGEFTDRLTIETNERTYRIDLSGLAVDTSRVAAETELPLQFEFGPTYPNPASDFAVITYSLPNAAHARIEVYDVLGRGVLGVIDRVVPRGAHSVRIPLDALGSGLYFCRITTPTYSASRSLVVQR